MSLRLVSWNLFGLERRHLDERTEAAMFRVLLGGPPELALQSRPPPPPPILLLQEVVERTWFAHLRPHLIAAGYQLFPEQLPARNYFEVIAVRGLNVRRARTTRFDRTAQGRFLNVVEVDLDEGPLTVMTAHLESLKSGSELRTEQAQRVLDALSSRPRAVFAGDTNLRGAEVEKLEFHQAADAFEQAGSPSVHRTTWGKARYDRCWSVGMDVVAFETFGAEVLPGIDEPASDHLGIAVTLEARP